MRHGAGTGKADDSIHKRLLPQAFFRRGRERIRYATGAGHARMSDVWESAGDASGEWYPEPGLNRHSQRPRDFKSLVSTNFTIRAWKEKFG